MAAVKRVAVDWGTSSFRLWVLDAAGDVLATRQAASGMGTLSRDAFAPLLERHLAELGLGPEIPVVICGMAGAAQGWCEAPYLALPSRLDDLGRHAVRVPGRRDVRILPGLKQSAPANVMRGEECQIAGYLQQQPAFDGVLCLPGTHSKWVRVTRGRVQGFATCMTGEIFALLSTGSVLRHAVEGAGWNAAAFRATLRMALAAPGEVACRLFELRAEGLLDALPPAVARARLSGLLIGQELAAMRDYWKAGAVTLIGAPALAETYRAALADLAVRAQVENAERMTLAGLTAAAAQFEDAFS